jgi:hypothetical protein
VAVKPHPHEYKLYKQKVYFGELQDDVKREKTFSKTRRCKSKTVTPANPSIRYFNPDDSAEALENDQVLYRFHSLDTVNVCAIYSSVKYENAIYESEQACGGRLQSFTVSRDQIREYVELINDRCEKVAKATSMGIRVEESSSDDENMGFEAMRPASFHEQMGFEATATMRTWGGRQVERPANYAIAAGRRGQKWDATAAPEPIAAPDRTAKRQKTVRRSPCTLTWRLRMPLPFFSLLGGTLVYLCTRKAVPHLLRQLCRFFLAGYRLIDEFLTGYRLIVDFLTGYRLMGRSAIG